MEPDVGLGIGRQAAGDTPPRPRPTVLIRLIEFIGLAMVIYGLGDFRFGLVAVGGAMIIGSYALYRRKHGPARPVGSDSGSDSPDVDGGGE